MHLFGWFQHNGMGLFWAVVIFSFLLFFHEFGHFIVAKRVGIKVLEFAFGFGYRLLGWKRGETEYALRLFPLGAYVRMLGEGDDGALNDPGNFQNKKTGQKIAVVAAGPLMNYFLAILLLFVLGISYGISTYVFEIGRIIPGMPAARAGLQKGDQILAINGQEYRSDHDPEQLVENIVTRIHDSANKPIDLQIRRGTKIFHVSATPVLDGKDHSGYLGIMPSFSLSFVRTSFTEALANSFSSTWYFTKSPFIEIEKIFQGKRKASELAKGTAGPVGMADLIVIFYNRYRAQGDALAYLLWLTALLNIFIGLFNLFPIPALDGSRIYIMGIGALFGKPLNPKLEEKIHFVGFAFLLLLMVLITYQDIWRIVTHKGL